MVVEVVVAASAAGVVARVAAMAGVAASAAGVGHRRAASGC